MKSFWKYPDYPIRIGHEVENFPYSFVSLDDNALLGWDTLIQQIMYGVQLPSNFISLVPQDKESDASLQSRVAETISSFQPDLILLDLRLRNEIGPVNDINSLSGTKLLKFIKKNNSFIPIIILTASNKSNIALKLLEIGAYSVWTKEGIDEQMNVNEEIYRYKDFLSILVNCFSESFKKADRFIYGLNFEMKRLEGKVTKLRMLDMLKRISSISANKIHGLINFDICLVDTNIFLNQVNTAKYYKSLRCLLELFKQNNKENVIINESYDEIIKYSKFHIDKSDNDRNQLYKTARFAFGLIQSYEACGLIHIHGLNSKFDIRSYADPVLAEYVKTQFSSGKSILFLTNDSELRGIIFQNINEILSVANVSNTRYFIATGKEMVQRMEPLVEKIDK